MAIIALEEIRCYANHGYYDEEQITGNFYLVDLEVESETRQASLTDDLFLTVNYETLHFMVLSEMKKSSRLLETVAERIASRISTQYEQVQGVKVTIRKLGPPLPGQVKAARVTVATGSLRSSGGGGRGGGMRGFGNLFE